MDATAIVRFPAFQAICFAGYVLLLFAPAPSEAGDGYCRCDHSSHQFFDGSTMCRWKRTWHGPNAVWTPLNPYYIPRPPDPCRFGGSACFHGGEHCFPAAAGDSSYPAEYPELAYHSQADLNGIHAGFERLGQIPNDQGIATGLPAAPPPSDR